MEPESEPKITNFGSATLIIELCICRKINIYRYIFKFMSLLQGEVAVGQSSGHICADMASKIVSMFR